MLEASKALTEVRIAVHLLVENFGRGARGEARKIYVFIPINPSNFWHELILHDLEVTTQ